MDWRGLSKREEATDCARSGDQAEDDDVDESASLVDHVIIVPQLVKWGENRGLQRMKR